MAPRGRPKSNSSQVSDNTLSEVKSDVEKNENVVSAQINMGGTTAMNKDISNEKLLEFIANLQQQIIQLQQKDSDKSEYSYDDDEFNRIDIRQDDYIKVVSLCPNELNISTERGGKGKVFTFQTFGSSKRILYSDLVQIMETYQHFLNDGLFYIADKRVMRRHGLDDVYSRILNENMIRKILDGAVDNDAVSVVKSSSRRQQEMIAQMLIDRRIENPDGVDLNFWDKLDRAIEIDLQQKYEDTKEYIDSLNNKE